MSMALSIIGLLAFMAVLHLWREERDHERRRGR